VGQIDEGAQARSHVAASWIIEAISGIRGYEGVHSLRTSTSLPEGKLYRDRYMNDAYLDALAEIHRSCERHGLDAISVALRWLIHHSQLNAERNDGVIIGASSVEHLRHNLTAVSEGLNKLVEEWATIALAQLDAENHYRLRAAGGWPEAGLALLDKLDRTLGRRSARRKTTG
jgi:hypothetical protein